MEAESVPVYNLKQRGRSIHAFFDYEAVITAVADGRAKYGYLWRPVAARLLGGRTDVVTAAGFQPEDRWNSALAAGRRPVAACRPGQAVGALDRAGVVTQNFARHGVPYLAPEENPASTSQAAGPR